MEVDYNLNNLNSPYFTQKDNLKTMYMVEHVVSSRTLFMARGIKVKGKKNTMITFYETPTGTLIRNIFLSWSENLSENWSDNFGGRTFELGLTVTYRLGISVIPQVDGPVSNSLYLVVPYNLRYNYRKGKLLR